MAALSLAGLTACASAPAAHTPPAGRFGDISEIVIAADSGVVPRADRFGRYAMPAYPDSARAAGTESRPVVAFVIDTTGRLEVRTLTFLEPTPIEFRQALCAWARKATFTTTRRAGQLRRELVVQPFAFEITGSRHSIADTEPYRKRLRDLPAQEAFVQLERLPHC